MRAAGIILLVLLVLVLFTEPWTWPEPFSTLSAIGWGVGVVGALILILEGGV